jgi:WD40 repeat protein
MGEVNIRHTRLGRTIPVFAAALIALLTSGCSEIGQGESDFGELREIASSNSEYFDAAYIEEENILVAVTMGSSIIHHLDPNTLQEITQIPLPSDYSLETFDGFGGEIRGRHFSPDGRQIIFTTGDPFVFNSGYCVVVDSISGDVLAELPTAATCNFAYSADSALLFHSDVFAGVIRSYDTINFEVVAELPIDQGTVHLVALSPGLVYSHNDVDFEAGLNPDGTKLTFVSSEGATVTETPIGSPVTTLISFPGYQWLLVESLNQTELIAVDAETGAVSGFVDGYALGGSPGFLSFVGRDGVFLLGTDDGQLFQLDETTPAVRRSLEVGISQINALALSPDGKLLFVFGDTTKVFSTTG